MKKDFKLKIKAEEYNMLVKAFPKLLEEYGMKMKASINDGGWAYCSICKYYYTKNVDILLRCPLCGRALRHVDKTPKKRIDPEKYLGVVE